MSHGGMPKDVVFGSVHERNVASVRMLNSVVLPVQYSDKFYADLLKLRAEFVHMAYYKDVFVGAICARVEPARPPAGAVGPGGGGGGSAEGVVHGAKGVSGSETSLYIMTLGVLAPYRGRGIGSALVRRVLDEAEKEPRITSVYLHVQTSNTDAIKLYERLGFEVGEKIEGYYKRVDPPDCFVLRKVLRH